MFAGQSLQDVMNAVGVAIDGLKPSPQPVLNDFDAFLRIDPLLSQLHKEYLDAKDQRRRAKAEFGDDGMCEMAAILEDSAWCSMQARYMELRGDAGRMAAANQIIKDDRRERAEEKARDERERQNAMQEYLIMAELVRRRHGCDEAALWMYAALILMSQNNVQRAAFFRAQAASSHPFNRLAA